MLLNIIDEGLRGGDPYFNILKLIHISGNIMTIGCKDFEPPGDPDSGNEVIDLREINRIFVFGAAKGIQYTAKAFEDLLGNRLTGGHVIDKKGTDLILNRISVTFGAHPIPDEGCVEGCRRIIEMCRDLREDDLVFTLTGNGQGSLLTLPVDEVSLEDLRRTIYIFQIKKGGPTIDLMPIRNHLDQMKGGKFARYIHPARSIHIFGDLLKPYDELMNNPNSRWLNTLPDYQTYADAVNSLKKWDAWDEVPESVRTFLTKADPYQETLGMEEYREMCSRIFCILPEHTGILFSAKKKAEEYGFKTYTLYEDFCMAGAEAVHVGKVVANMAIHSEIYNDPFETPCAIFSRGETVVTMGSVKGMGGRNQEFALSAALELAERGETVIVGSVDTDGTDGPGHQFTDGSEDQSIPVLTGGLVDNSTYRRAKELGVDIFESLRKHNASPALYALGDGIVATPNLSMGDLSVTLVMGKNKIEMKEKGKDNG